jgi:serine/threonine protein kinase
MEPTPGTQFAGYRIDSVVGRGGMGVVYRATELALDRPVALKLIAPELAGDTSFRERFLRESRLAASIDHAGILPVYTAGEVEGELFLANRFVDGTDLRTLLDDGTLPPERALELVGQVADALDAAHERGLVHRDVKPANVLVDAADHCYLSDFGLSTQLGAGGTTASGRLAGSLDYLAPEQIRRGEVDGRTDQYALACVLYELLTGAPPFRRETEAQTLWAHMQEEPPALPEYPALDPVLARALAKEQGERYASCDEFVDDARAALGLGPSPVAIRRRRRRLGGRLLYAGAALLGLAVVATVLAVTLGSDDGLEARPNSVGVVDPASLELTRAISVGNTPTEVAASDQWVWVLNSNDGAGTITRLDAQSGTEASTFSVGGTPRSVLSAFGSLWVGTVEGRVFRIDPSTDLVEEEWTLRNAGRGSAFEVDPGAGWLAEGSDAVWAASFRTISRIDPETSELLPRPSEVWGPMAYGFRSLWVLAEELERLSPASMQRLATVELPGSSVDIATGHGSVWVSDEEGDAVLRVDPRDESLARTYGVGGSALGVAVATDTIWAATEAGTVARIDPLTDEVTSVPVGGLPRSVAVGATAVWVSVN